MKKFLLIFSTIFFFCLSAYSQDKIINENITFKPFKCNQIKSEFIRTKSENECLVIQKLENSYEVKHQKYSNNTWNTPQLIKYINNKEPMRGIEPRTLGLEVPRAIQLRHMGSLLFNQYF